MSFPGSENSLSIWGFQVIFRCVATAIIQHNGSTVQYTAEDSSDNLPVSSSGEPSMLILEERQTLWNVEMTVCNERKHHARETTTR